jgi:hypothetical protein
MRRVFTAATLLEANLVQQMLEAEFIPAVVFNENAHGAAGELPITEAWPEVWIKGDCHYSEARSIIERYETTSCREMRAACAQCGESNPINFEMCWHCRAMLSMEK